MNALKIWPKFFNHVPKHLQGLPDVKEFLSQKENQPSGVESSAFKKTSQ